MEKPIQFSKIELDNIVQDYNNGMKPYELSQKYKRNSASIIGKLKSIGIYVNKNYRFTNEDIEFLKLNYPVGNWEEIENRFPKLSNSSIHTKMSKMGIESEFKWSDEEIFILKNNYAQGNLNHLQSMLPNRKYKAITTKAKKLGLKTRDFWSDEEIDIMNHNYHIKTVDEMMFLLPNRTRRSIIGQAQKLNLSSICRYNKDETQFIIDNWTTMSDKEIGAYLNRPYSGIVGKRLLLGLLREKEESSYNDLSEYVRRNNLEWKKQSMITCHYKCFLTGERFDDIHHIYGLNLILNEALNELDIEIKESMNDYTNEELRDILETFRMKQSAYPLGICLSKSVHTLFHNIYGYGNNTQAQWKEFLINHKNNVIDLVA